MKDDMQIIEEVMENSEHFCEHEYLPEEDGTVYKCGSDFDVAYIRFYEMYLCLKHRHEYFTQE